MAGRELPRVVYTAPRVVVHVRVPAQHPSVIAGLNLNILCPSHKPADTGVMVASAPARNNSGPTALMPDTKVDADSIAITAISEYRQVAPT